MRICNGHLVTRSSCGPLPSQRVCQALTSLTLPDDVMKCVHLQYDASLCFAKLMIQPVNSRQATHAHTCSKHHELMHIFEVDCSRFGQAELCNQTQIELGFKNGSCYGVYIIPYHSNNVITLLTLLIVLYIVYLVSIVVCHSFSTACSEAGFHWQRLWRTVM